MPASHSGGSGPGRLPRTSDPDDLDLEAPEADAAEQHASLVEEEGDSLGPTDDILEADPADRAEQERVVETDEDEYR